MTVNNNQCTPVKTISFQEHQNVLNKFKNLPLKDKRVIFSFAAQRLSLRQLLVSQIR